MNAKIPRRDFIKAVPVAAWAVSHAAQSFAAEGPSGAAKVVLQPFDYDGVKLLPSRWQKQYQAAREFWMGLSEDDILHGYRQAAGLPAPGKALGGWCRQTSDTVFGQWLSGMARIAKATGDTELRDKAVRLFKEWSKTINADGNARMGHYPFEKLACGLLDLEMYCGLKEAGEMLSRVTDWAAKSLDRSNMPAKRITSPSGRPSEWYTVAENFYRAYQRTGDAKYRTFGDAWLYADYWDKFADTSNPAEAYGYHAYSHVNTFSSAAMVYGVTGNDRYLKIIRNAYDWLQNTQCYATGGYGPSETTVAGKGGLGQVLEVRSDTFETACGSWAGFKLTRYLMGFTGEARYGDWAERLLYNGIGAALPVKPDGKTFYYSDYRTGGGTKVPYWDAWPCCAGTYIQAVADYPNLIYFKDASGLYVNLFVASEVTWKRTDGDVKVTQETSYPEAETTTLKVEAKDGTKFPLKFRVPAWANDVTVKLNGEAFKTDCKPGTWAAIDRAWKSGDQVEIKIPLVLRMVAVDKQHPDRVAAVRGPVAMVMEGLWQEIDFKLPKTDAEFSEMLSPDRMPGNFQVKSPGGGFNHSKFRPFYSEPETLAYYMYFDKGSLPVVMW
jgi:DUF1680 family protein